MNKKVASSLISPCESIDEGYVQVEFSVFMIGWGNTKAPCLQIRKSPKETVSNVKWSKYIRTYIVLN